MKIYGKRADGSLLISLGAGVGVIMRGQHASKAVDLGVLQKMGPWAPTENSLEARRAVQKQLDRCKVIGLTQFHLGLPTIPTGEMPGSLPNVNKSLQDTGADDKIEIELTDDEYTALAAKKETGYSYSDGERARMKKYEAKKSKNLTMTYDDKRRKAGDALRQKLGLGGGGGVYPAGGSDFWVKDMDDDNVYYCIGGKDYRQPYTYSDATMEFTFPGDPVETMTQQIDKPRG